MQGGFNLLATCIEISTVLNATHVLRAWGASELKYHISSSARLSHIDLYKMCAITHRQEAKLCLGTKSEL